MGLFSSSRSTSEDPEIRKVEKLIANEAKSDQKNLDHVLKDVKKADKTHSDSVKASDNAQHALDRAIKREHETAEALNKAEHEHDSAVADQRNAEKTLELKRQQESRLAQDLEQRRSSLDEAQKRKAANDAVRESRLAQMHEQAATRARAGSFDGSNGPADVRNTRSPNVGGHDA